nr:hypothetical protein [Frigoribacterium sp. NBH87]
MPSDLLKSGADGVIFAFENTKAIGVSMREDSGDAHRSVPFSSDGKNLCELTVRKGMSLSAGVNERSHGKTPNGPEK